MTDRDDKTVKQSLAFLDFDFRGEEGLSANHFVSADRQHRLHRFGSRLPSVALLAFIAAGEFFVDDRNSVKRHATIKDGSRRRSARLIDVSHFAAVAICTTTGPNLRASTGLPDSAARLR